MKPKMTSLMWLWLIWAGVNGILLGWNIAKKDWVLVGVNILVIAICGAGYYAALRLRDSQYQIKKNLEVIERMNKEMETWHDL